MSIVLCVAVVVVAGLLGHSVGYGHGINDCMNAIEERWEDSNE